MGWEVTAGSTVTDFPGGFDGQELGRSQATSRTWLSKSQPAASCEVVASATMSAFRALVVRRSAHQNVRVRYADASFGRRSTHSSVRNLGDIHGGRTRTRRPLCANSAQFGSVHQLELIPSRDFEVGLAHDCRVRSGLPSGTVTFVFSDVRPSVPVAARLSVPCG